MELTSRMKMARLKTFWIQMRKNKPLDKSRKTGQTSRTKMAFYSTKKNYQFVEPARWDRWTSKLSFHYASRVHQSMILCG
ncbi:hypothetical protein Hanom_Chr16g01420921 [Helianthus anomalus]